MISDTGQDMAQVASSTKNGSCSATRTSVDESTLPFVYPKGGGSHSPNQLAQAFSEADLLECTDAPYIVPDTHASGRAPTHDVRRSDSVRSYISINE